MTGLAYKQAAGLESDLLKCREAAERALGNSKPRVRALREVLSKYRQAIGEIGAGVMESESAAVQETAGEFTRELDTVKSRLLRLADEAGEGLDSCRAQKCHPAVTLTLGRC